MSILQQVMEEYGNCQNPESPTDKTDKRVESPISPTDKTDKRASVSSVSEWSELLKNSAGEFSASEILVVAEMVAIVEMRERGEIPEHYAATTECKWCGPVPIWVGCPPEVQGCPWCFNRHKGLPMPQVT